MQHFDTGAGERGTGLFEEQPPPPAEESEEARAAAAAAAAPPTCVRAAPVYPPFLASLAERVANASAADARALRLLPTFDFTATRSARHAGRKPKLSSSASREASRGAATVASVANSAPLSLPSAFVSLLARSLVALHHKRVYGCSHYERPPISGYIARQHKGRLHALLLQPAVLRAAPRAARRVPSRRGLLSSDTSSVF